MLAKTADEEKRSKEVDCCGLTSVDETKCSFRELRHGPNASGGSKSN